MEYRSSRRDILKLAMGLPLAGSLSSLLAGSCERKRPNILFLLSDDHTSAAMGCMGNAEVKTPRMDALAAKGVLFTRCYAVTAICMPSRVTMMTGLYEYRHGTNFQFGNLDSKLWDRYAYPVLLRRAGYRVGFAGKLGFEVDGKDISTDFDRWGKTEGGQGNYETGKNPLWGDYAERYPHLTRAMGQWGCDFIEASAKEDRPFCLSLSFKAPHCPHTNIDPADQKLFEGVRFTRPVDYGRKAGEHLATQAKLGRQYYMFEDGLYGGYPYTEEHYDQAIRSYYQLISGLDTAIGTVLDKLMELGIADNTVVIYASDNGYFNGRLGLAGKVLPYEAATRVPLIIYDPRIHKDGGGGQRCESIVGTVDIASTILELAGIGAGDVDGGSLVPLIKQPGGTLHESLPLIQNWGWAGNDHNKGLSVVTDEWKYIYWAWADEKVEPAEELYSMTGDPLEMKNVADEKQYADVLERMRTLYDGHLAKWKKQCVDKEAYTRCVAIFDRHIPWRQKRFKGFYDDPDPNNSRNGKTLEKVYEELVK